MRVSRPSSVVRTRPTDSRATLSIVRRPRIPFKKGKERVWRGGREGVSMPNTRSLARSLQIGPLFMHSTTRPTDREDNVDDNRPTDRNRFSSRKREQRDILDSSCPPSFQPAGRGRGAKTHAVTQTPDNSALPAPSLPLLSVQQLASRLLPWLRRLIWHS